MCQQMDFVDEEQIYQNLHHRAVKKAFEQCELPLTPNGKGTKRLRTSSTA